MTATEYRNKKYAYHIASMLLMIATVLFYIIYLSCTTKAKGGLASEILGVILPYSITAIILVACVIFISNKFRTTAWMAAAILGTIVFNRVGLIVTFVLWAFDEYFLNAQYQKNKLNQQMAKVRDE